MTRAFAGDGHWHRLRQFESSNLYVVEVQPHTIRHSPLKCLENEECNGLIEERSTECVMLVDRDCGVTPSTPFMAPFLKKPELEMFVRCP